MTHEPTCPRCNEINRPGARYCRHCGASMARPNTPAPAAGGAPEPVVEAKRWRRRPGEIAARVESSDLPGRWTKELIVEEGTNAIILEDGQSIPLAGPGRYPMQSLPDRLRHWGQGREMTAILVESGEIHLDFQLPDLWSRDPLRLSGRCEVAVQISDAEKFAVNLLKGRPTYSESDLRAFLHPEVRHAAQVYVGEMSIAQLEAGLAERPEFLGIDLHERLRQALSQSGLAFRRVRLFDLHHSAYDALRQQQEELYLGPQQAANRKRLFDLRTEEELQTIAEEESEVAQFELRAAVWQRMRQAVLEDRINSATSDEEWEKFIAQVDRRKLLREDELKQLRESLAWQGEDRRKERAHTAAMADLYAEFEMKGARLTEQYRHDQERQRTELELARQETFGRLELRRRQVEMELELQDMQLAAERRRRKENELDARERQMADEMHRLQIAWEQAKSEAERRRLEIDIERLEDDNDLLTVEKAQAMMRHNREEKLRIDREHWIASEQARLAIEERQLEMRLRAEAETHRQQMEREAQSQRHELDRMGQMAQMSVEALIAVSGPEQAEFLGELARTEILAGFTEEQILAMAVEKNPQVMEAFKAKYQAASEGKLGVAEAEKWQAIAEMTARHQSESSRQADASLDRQERASREAAERQERIINETLRQMGDVARSATQRPESGPSVIFGPGGSSYTVGGGSSAGVAATPAQGETRTCPKCGVSAPIDQKFCKECGNRLIQ